MPNHGATLLVSTERVIYSFDLKYPLRGIIDEVTSNFHLASVKQFSRIFTLQSEGYFYITGGSLTSLRYVLEEKNITIRRYKLVNL